MSIENENSPQISEEMREFLEQQGEESEIQAVLDAALEIGLKDYTRNDVIKALLEEKEKIRDE